MRRNLHAGGRPCNEGSRISRTFNPRMEYVTNQLEAHAWTRPRPTRLVETDRHIYRNRRRVGMLLQNRREAGVQRVVHCQASARRHQAHCQPACPTAVYAQHNARGFMGVSSVCAHCAG